MLIICEKDEEFEIRNTCSGHCKECVFGNVRCPIEYSMIITTKEISKGEDLYIKLFNS